VGVLSKVERVFGDEALVAATLGVPLIEAASLLRRAVAVDLLAAVEREMVALRALVELINVFTALA